MTSNLLNNQVTGLAALPFTSQSKTQGSPSGATLRDLTQYVLGKTGWSLQPQVSVICPSSAYPSSVWVGLRMGTAPLAIWIRKTMINPVVHPIDTPINNLSKHVPIAKFSVQQNNDHPWQIATPIFKQSHCHHQTAPLRSPVYSSTVAFTQCRKPSLTISLEVYGCIPNKKPLFGMVYYLFYHIWHSCNIPTETNCYLVIQGGFSSR